MKLTLRELFLIVVIAAMGCGWWVREWQLVRSNAQLANDNEALRRELRRDL
jgi:hypothetical protein